MVTAVIGRVGVAVVACASALAWAVTPDDLPQTAPPPAWIQWLGWSEDGRRIAWREGPADRQQAPGQPIEIARLDARGAIVDRLHVEKDVNPALGQRRIRMRRVAQVQRVAPGDLLVRTDAGRLFAVALRGTPAQVAVLEKRGDAYEPVARWAVRSPASRIEVAAFPDLARRLVAVVVHSGAGKARQASLMVLPLVAEATATTALPAAATASAP